MGRNANGITPVALKILTAVHSINPVSAAGGNSLNICFRQPACEKFKIRIVMARQCMSPSHHIEKVSILDALTGSDDRVRRGTPQVCMAVAKVMPQLMRNQEVFQRVTLDHGSRCSKIGHAAPWKSDIRKARDIKLVAG